MTSPLLPTYARADVLFERGEGPWLIARGGERYLDFAGGIAVNSLSPGYILSDTGLANSTHVEEERLPVRNSRAFKRDAYPEDLLGTLVFLASSDSDFVTGQTIYLGGVS